MTVPLLLAYIAAAFLLQLVVGIVLARWWRGRSMPEIPATSAEEHRAAEVGGWTGWRTFRVEQRTYEDEDRTQCSFLLMPVDGAPLSPFRPGQFLTFALQIADSSAAGELNEPRTIVRCYSLSDRPDPAAYRVTIKRVPAPADRPDLPPGIVSTHFHDLVQTGDSLMLKPPAGRFFIDPDPDVPAVFLCGGIGVTPMMSMLRWCLDEQPMRKVHLYYGVRHGGEHAFRQALRDLVAGHPNFHLTVLYSRPDPKDAQGRDYQQAGHLDIDLVRRTLPHGRHQFYVCGPASMMESLVPALTTWGALPGDIHHEAFGPASTRSVVGAAPATPLGAPFNVTFRRSGRTLAWDGNDANLLDFAERHGVAVESGCRSGSCGSCETKLVSGAVQYAAKPDHVVASDCCLLCVATPASALLLEA